MARALRRWCLGLTLLLAACASTPRPLAIEEGGRVLWQRVETAHFVVESNSDSSAPLRRVALELESLWKAYAMTPLLGRRPPQVKPIVVVVRYKNEYEHLAGSGSAGYFAHASALGPMIVLPADSGAFRATVIKHELAHFVSSDYLRGAPLWLLEGLAQVMETAQYDAERGELLLGAHSPLQIAESQLALPAERVLADWPERMNELDRARFYGRSWLLVHLLIDEHLPQFSGLLDDVSRGADWRTAWRSRRLPDFSSLDGLLARYQRRALFGVWRVAVRSSELRVGEPGAMDMADALALRAALLALPTHPERTDEQSVELARLDLQRALAADPGNERARKVEAALASRAQPFEH